MKEINQLFKISKFLQYLAFFIFFFNWADFIFYFTNYSSPGELCYKEYGLNGISIYYGLIIILSVILLAQSKKIADIAYELEKTAK